MQCYDSVFGSNTRHVTSSSPQTSKQTTALVTQGSKPRNGERGLTKQREGSGGTGKGSRALQERMEQIGRMQGSKEYDDKVRKMRQPGPSDHVFDAMKDFKIPKKGKESGSSETGSGESSSVVSSSVVSVGSEQEQTVEMLVSVRERSSKSRMESDAMDDLKRIEEEELEQERRQSPEKKHKRKNKALQEFRTTVKVEKRNKGELSLQVNGRAKEQEKKSRSFHSSSAAPKVQEILKEADVLKDLEDIEDDGTDCSEEELVLEVVKNPKVLERVKAPLEKEVNEEVNFDIKQLVKGKLKRSNGALVYHKEEESSRPISLTSSPETPREEEVLEVESSPGSVRRESTEGLDVVQEIEEEGEVIDFLEKVPKEAPKTSMMDFIKKEPRKQQKPVKHDLTTTSSLLDKVPKKQELTSPLPHLKPKLYLTKNKIELSSDSDSEEAGGLGSIFEKVPKHKSARNILSQENPFYRENSGLRSQEEAGWRPPGQADLGSPLTPGYSSATPELRSSRFSAETPSSGERWMPGNT